jgi:hypothetical protein
VRIISVAELSSSLNSMYAATSNSSSGPAAQQQQQQVPHGTHQLQPHGRAAQHHSVWLAPERFEAPDFSPDPCVAELRRYVSVWGRWGATWAVC